MVRIGFTGSQRGMTELQRAALEALLADKATSEFHHGDCIGADAQAHDLAVAMLCEPVIHPPINESKRAFKSAKRICPARRYLARNKEIVRESDLLIATPGEAIEQLRSGTWSTVRFARKLGKPVFVILPDGKVSKLNVST